MKFKCSKKLISWFLCMMLIVAMAFTTVGCNTNNQAENLPTQEVQGNEEGKGEIQILGEGQHLFYFIVVDKDGNETEFEIHTDKETVGDALLDLNLISGEVGEYGLYVKSVNNITAEYSIDQTYWAFYVNGEYATTGVDTTAIEEGTTYSFRVEK